MQDTALAPSPDELAAASRQQEREYYVEEPCEMGAACGGEGVVLPFDQGNAALDALFGINDVESLPLSDEILPVVFDGGVLTEEGLLDSFARHHPERAAFLLQLLSPTGTKLGLGYSFEFIDDGALAAPYQREIADLTPQLNQITERQRQLRGSIRGMALGGPAAAPGAQQEGIALEGERIRISNRLRELNAALANFGLWRIDDDEKKIYAYTSINRNVARAPLAEYFSGDRINLLPTNREGADWLYAIMGDWMVRNGFPGANSDEEFFRNWLTRKAAGVALVGLGALEIFGGVAATIGSSGLGTVAGVALTVVGFEALTAGIDMLWTPDRHAGQRGWIGDLIHDTATRFGGEGVAQAFDRGWAVTQIVAGLGAPVAIRYAARQATRVAQSGRILSPITRGRLTSARLGIAEVRRFRMALGAVIDYTPLPSGRGAILSINGVGRFRVPVFDMDIRWLLRLSRSRVGQLQERSRELGQGMAGFARGPIRNQGQAIAFVHEVGRHMGLSAADIRQLVSRIEFGNTLPSGVFRSSSFNVRRVLHIRGDVGTPLMRAGTDYNELRAFIEVAHELNHALAYQRYIARGGSPERYWRTMFNANRPLDRNGRTLRYFEEEIRVESAAAELAVSVSRRMLAAQDRTADAQQVRRLLDEALAESDEFISKLREIMVQ